MADLVAELRAIAGPTHVLTDPDLLAARSIDYTGRHRGVARALVRPGVVGEVAAVLNACRQGGVPVTIQGGRTSLVAGTVPAFNDVLLSTERLTGCGPVQRAEGTVTVGAGVTLAQLRRHAADAGLQFGVDLSARDSATIGGMAATNAGGLHTVRYGNMREQVVGMEIVLPDGTVTTRRNRVRADNTGYDLLSLWVGSEGTLGVITAVEVLLRPPPRHRVSALAPFATLGALLAVSEELRHVEGISALELLDGRGVRLAHDRLGVRTPAPAPWFLLAELAGPRDQSADLAATFAGAALVGEPAVGPQTWAVREAFAEVTRLFGPPVKFDIALPVPGIPSFAQAAEELLARTCPTAVPVLFGHVGEGNLHLNVLNCPEEPALTGPMMELIAAHGGNVSSEHGVGTLKSPYLRLALAPENIAAMSAVKAAFDPTHYLNPAVLFAQRTPPLVAGGGSSPT